jgi:nucleotide-binding universal stress UspA family protein
MREPATHGLRTILAATDFSPAAETGVARAADLAAVYGADLCLVHALAWFDDAAELAYLDAAAAAELQRAAEERLERVAQPLRGRGLRVATVVAPGPPSQVVLETAVEVAADLIVVGTRGVTGWRHVLLGSTAQRVIEGADCPVLAVHRGDPLRALRPRRVLVATDFSPDAAAAVRGADALLGLSGDTVVLMHAYQPPPLLVGPAAGAFAGGRTVFEGVRERATWRLAQEAEALALDGRKPAMEVREGYAPDAIVAAARDLDADLVVMGSCGRTGMAHLLLGSTAERVVQHAGCPVLVVPRKVREAGRGAETPLAERDLVPAGFQAVDDEC